MKKNLFIFPVLILGMMLVLAGCGKSSKQSEYDKYFSEFCKNVASIDANIKAIDPNSENAPSELLAQLDVLNTQFSEMSQKALPDEYDYLTNLATESGEYMNLAVENYHTAFESVPFDSDSAEIADQYYERANKRLNYMIIFMQGGTPDTDEISYTSESEGE